MFDTFFQKKTLYASITGLFVGLILLCCPFFISADNIFNDHFDGYAIGALNGQGSWACSQNLWFVNNVDYQSTPQSIRTTAQYLAQCYKNGDQLSEGGGSFWVKSQDCGHGTSRYETFYFRFQEGTNSKIQVMIDPSQSDPDLCTLVIGGYSIPLSSDYFNTWKKISVGWKQGEGVSLFRFSYDQETYSDWYSMTSFSYIDRIFIQSSYATGGSQWYIDTIDTAGTICEPESCSACETSEDCLSAGCTYEYLPTWDRWECHTTWTPYIPGCGTGFQESCYGCYTQETCESAIPTGVCEWVDKGYGLGCYPTEEVPEEAVWEVPELEECGELSGVEKWLCEIKNWLAGLFMPTQEKVNNLKETVDNFKAKFPFNYANSLSVFFDTIKTSLATPKDIPVEIFGNPGNLNFDFLEASGTIGGTSETIKNILFDFSTALIIIGFLFWIISFIKRIF